jgi:RNA polymerase sigma-70 factor (ECF subfamily)
MMPSTHPATLLPDMPAPPVRVEARERPSFEEVYDAHFDFVWRTAARLNVPESALDDAVQEVFVVVHRRLADCFDTSTIRSWLYAIVVNVARTFRRAAMRGRVEGAAENAERTMAPPGPGPDETTERMEGLTVLQSILGGMDEERLEVFVLVELEELSVPEAARLLGIKLNTAYKRLRVGRQEFNEAAVRYRAREAWRGR